GTEPCGTVPLWTAARAARLPTRWAGGSGGNGGPRLASIPEPLGGLLVGRPQPVTDAGFGHQVVRPLGIRLDLAPQLAHVDAQILRVGWLVPELVQQELVRHNLARMLHQQAEQIVLLGRELHLLVVDPDDPA